MNSQIISLTELQKHFDRTCKEKGWGKNSVTEVFLLFAEEVGELAKAIRKETGLRARRSLTITTTCARNSRTC